MHIFQLPILIAFAIHCAIPAVFAVEIPKATAILANLRKEHPRLLASTNDFAALRRQVLADDTLRRWHSDLQRQARQILAAPVSRYEIPERGITLLNRKTVLIQDEINPRAPSKIWWFLHTPAEIEIGADPSSAMFHQGTARLWAKILAPKNAAFQSLPAEPLPESPHPEGQAENHEIRKLAFGLDQSAPTRIAVWLVPLRATDQVPATLPPVRPLSAWP